MRDSQPEAACLGMCSKTAIKRLPYALLKTQVKMKARELNAKIGAFRRFAPDSTYFSSFLPAPKLGFEMDFKKSLGCQPELLKTAPPQGDVDGKEDRDARADEDGDGL
jgi:hypothetical protein